MTTKQDPRFLATSDRWRPMVSTADTGEISMLWHLGIGSRYRGDGGFVSPIDLNYRAIQVELEWTSDNECDLSCRGPGQKNWKDLHDSGYRAILGIDRYVGPVASVNGVDRSVWWVAVFTVYGAVDGPRSYDANDLMKAAAANDVQQIGELLAKGIDIEVGDMIGVTALCCAAESGALQAFNFLLEKGANAKVVTSGGGTLLHSAAAGGKVEILSAVVELGVDLNARAQSGHTALGWAVLSGRAEAAQYLLRVGADQNAERGIQLCREAQSRFGENHALTKQLCG
jgi:hypothetical protein